jgi:hypothetical protein
MMPATSVLIAIGNWLSSHAYAYIVLTGLYPEEPMEVDLESL